MRQQPAGRPDAEHHHGPDLGFAGEPVVNSGPYTVTATATAGASTSSQSFTWNVTHVLLSSPGDQFNTQGDTVSVPLTASDPDSDTLSYSVSGLPSGLSINSATGLISGTIATTAGQSAPYTVTVTASDGSHTARTTFNWTVNPVLLTTPGDQFSVTGNAVSVQMQGTEGNGHALTYSASGLPAGLSISSAGLISGTLLATDARVNPYAVTVTASNGTKVPARLSTGVCRRCKSPAPVTRVSRRAAPSACRCKPLARPAPC